MKKNQLWIWRESFKMRFVNMQIQNSYPMEGSFSRRYFDSFQRQLGKKNFDCINP